MYCLLLRLTFLKMLLAGVWLAIPGILRAQVGFFVRQEPLIDTQSLTVYHNDRFGASEFKRIPLLHHARVGKVSVPFHAEFPSLDAAVYHRFVNSNLWISRDDPNPQSVRLLSYRQDESKLIPIDQLVIEGEFGDPVVLGSRLAVAIHGIVHDTAVIEVISVSPDGMLRRVQTLSIHNRSFHVPGPPDPLRTIDDSHINWFCSNSRGDHLMLFNDTQTAIVFRDNHDSDLAFSQLSVSDRHSRSRDPRSPALMDGAISPDGSLAVLTSKHLDSMTEREDGLGDDMLRVRVVDTRAGQLLWERLTYEPSRYYFEFPHVTFINDEQFAVAIPGRVDVYNVQWDYLRQVTGVSKATSFCRDEAQIRKLEAMGNGRLLLIERDWNNREWAFVQLSLLPTDRDEGNSWRFRRSR